MSVITNNLLLGDEGYFLTKSLRFRSSATAYLSRTPASAGNRKTWTYSTWIKRGAVGAEGTLISGGATTGRLAVFFDSTGRLISDVGGTGTFDQSTAVYRDPSAWYHFVWQFDTTQATAANRSRMYINGVQVTLTNTRTFTQNTDYEINNSTLQTLGTFSNSIGTYNFDGYQAETYFIDGQALTPSSFGETDPRTGVWIPKKYTGTYGTNGFYLPFTDVATTSGSNAGLGKDFSGNGNYWTTNNISVTSGSTYDSMKDVPTLTDTDTANYCTLNPLKRTDTNTSVINGNLTAQGYLTGGTDYRSVTGTMYQTDKFYFEATINSTGSSSNWLGQIGVANSSFNCPLATRVGGDSNSWSFAIRGGNGDVVKLNNNSATQLAASLPSAGDVIMIACDPANSKVWFGRNGTWYGSGDPAAGTNAAYTNVSSSVTPAAGVYYDYDVWGCNFGQRPFAYTPPSGFKALNTFNLPTPTIGATASTQANKYFDVVTRNGFGSSGGSVTSLNFQPDFWWEKARNTVSNNTLIDSIRGVTKELYSNLTNAESTGSNFLVSFNSNGFTMGSNDWGTSTTLVDWVWKANGSGSTNTAGSITSTVSANTTAGFSIVRWTGTSGSSFTIGHGLGVTPNMIILKNRSRAGTEWCVYHQDVGNTKALFLNSTGTGTTDSGFWNNTNPSSTVFTTGNGYLYYTGGISDNYVAYCFAQVAGYSAFGSYTGNGSSDGTFVHLGFRPRYFMVKRTDASSYDWILMDTARDPINVATQELYADLSIAEGTAANNYDILSNGFKARRSNAAVNASGGTYIYMAFAESPFKYSLAR